MDSATGHTTIYPAADYEKDTATGQVTKYHGALGHQVAMSQGTSGGASSLSYL